MNLRRYEESLQKYAKVAKQGGRFAAVSHHNTAAIFWRQGLYQRAWQELDRARSAYESALRDLEKANGVDLEPARSERAGVLVDCGNVWLALGDFETARTMFEQARQLDPEDPESFIGLMNISLEERKAEAGAGEGKYWEARAPFEAAKELLEKRLETRRDVPTLLRLASLHRSMDEHEELEALLTQVAETEPGSIDVLTGRAAIASAKDDFKGASRYLHELVRREPANLAIRTSLADSYAELGLWDKAEREYRTVLAISDCHVEAQIGLGQVLMVLGEQDDVLFEHARSAFEEALNHAKTMRGGGEVADRFAELSATQLAETLYSLGLAKVKLYEARIKEGIFLTGLDRSLLRSTRDDFQQAWTTDRTNHKSRRAIDRIEREIAPFAPQRVANEWAPIAVAALAVLLLALVQVNFYVGHLGKQIAAPVYFPLQSGPAALYHRGVLPAAALAPQGRRNRAGKELE